MATLSTLILKKGNPQWIGPSIHTQSGKVGAPASSTMHLSNAPLLPSALGLLLLAWAEGPLHDWQTMQGKGWHMMVRGVPKQGFPRASRKLQLGLRAEMHYGKRVLKQFRYCMDITEWAQTALVSLSAGSQETTMIHRVRCWPKQKYYTEIRGPRGEASLLLPVILILQFSCMISICITYLRHYPNPRGHMDISFPLSGIHFRWTK